MSDVMIHTKLVEDLHEYFTKLRSDAIDTLDLYDRDHQARRYLPLREWQAIRGQRINTRLSWDSFIQDPPEVMVSGGTGSDVIYALWVDYIHGNPYLSALEHEINEALGAGWTHRATSGRELVEIYSGYWDAILQCVGGEVEAVWDYLAQGLISLREYLEPAFRISAQEGYGYLFYVHEVSSIDLIIVGEYS